MNQVVSLLVLSTKISQKKKKKRKKSNSMNLSFAVGRNRVASLVCQGVLKGRQAVATSLAHPERLLYMT